jgi:putative transposase
MTSASDREIIIELVNEAVAAGARQSLACKEVRITPRTLQRWTNPKLPVEDQRPHAKRPKPKHRLTDYERQKILQQLNKPEFAGKPPSQIVPILADKGIYIASESTFYRVMRENKIQLSYGGTRKPHKQKQENHRITGKNQVWSWDITYLNGPIKGMYYYLYLILDIYTRDIVGWEVWEQETAENSSRLIRRAVLSQGVDCNKHPLVLHSDNGSPMKGATMLETLYELGVKPSRSRPRVSNDNPYSESIFRTCKYRPDYPAKGFPCLADAREWCKKFVHWYRHEHRHSGINFLTPSQHHYGLTEDILSRRKEVYAAARAKNPLRWKNKTRAWEIKPIVWLNRPKKISDEMRQLS